MLKSLGFCDYGQRKIHPFRSFLKKMGKGVFVLANYSNILLVLIIPFYYLNSGY